MDVDKSLQGLLNEVLRERAEDVEKGTQNPNTGPTDDKTGDPEQGKSRNTEPPSRAENSSGILGGIFFIVFVVFVSIGLLKLPLFAGQGLDKLISNNPLIAGLVILFAMVSLMDRSFPVERFISYRLTALLILGVLMLGYYMPGGPIQPAGAEWERWFFFAALNGSFAVLVGDIVITRVYQSHPISRTKRFAFRVKVAAIEAASFHQPKWPHIVVMVLVSLSALVIGYLWFKDSLAVIELSFQSLVLILFPLVFLYLSHSVLLWYTTTLVFAVALGFGEHFLLVQGAAAVLSCSIAGMFATMCINRVAEGRSLSQGFRNLIAIWIIVLSSVLFAYLSDMRLVRFLFWGLFPIAVTGIVGWAGGFSALFNGWLKKASWVYVFIFALLIGVLGFWYSNTDTPSEIINGVLIGLLFLLSLLAVLQKHWVHWIAAIRKEG